MQTAIENIGIQGALRLRVNSDVAYFLFRGKEAILIGAGRREHIPLVEMALKMNNLTWQDIRAILLPNADPWSFAGLPPVRERCKALIYIHRLEEPRLAMRHAVNPGWNIRRRIESRFLDKYGNRPCSPDIYISDGDILDLWYGLTVIALPGYSTGNCGFFCRHLNIVFTGSLPARTKLYRRIFEIAFLDAETLKNSRAKIAKIKPSAILES